MRGQIVRRNCNPEALGSGWLRGGLNLGEQCCWRGDEVLNSDVLAAHARPPRRMRQVIKMQKVGVVDSDAAIAERSAPEGRVRTFSCSESPGIAMSAAIPRVCSLFGDAAHFLIVRRTPVAVVHQRFLCRPASATAPEPASELPLRSSVRRSNGRPTRSSRNARSDRPPAFPRLFDTPVCELNTDSYETESSSLTCCERHHSQFVRFFENGGGRIR